MPYSHFTIDDRDTLQILMAYEGLAKWEIARILGKHQSSIYRELSRNEKSGVYLSHRADGESSKRRQASKIRPKRENDRLMAEVEKRIRDDHSPEQIAGRLKREHPEDTSWHVSHETIYQHVYARIQEGIDLQKHLRQAGKKRKKRSAHKDNRGKIPGRVFIDERPKIVEKKTRVGDWEGDTVEGGGKKGYILTYVDRKTKFLIARKIANKTAANVVIASRKAFASVPEALKKTITLDNGKEFAKHAAISRATGAKIFFAHPYHSWERGLNEHTNGKLRQYYPKKKPLDGISSRELAKKVKALNNRPRKSLGYQTPQEAITQELFALQT